MCQLFGSGFGKLSEVLSKMPRRVFDGWGHRSERAGILPQACWQAVGNLFCALPRDLRRVASATGIVHSDGGRLPCAAQKPPEFRSQVLARRWHVSSGFSRLG